MKQVPIILAFLVALSLPTLGKDKGEPTNASEAAAQKAKAEAQLEVKYQECVQSLSPEEQKWEKVLQSELGGFYLPIHKREKVAGKSNAWDFVKDDPALPRVLLIGDSISRAYTLTVRRELAGRANVHRAPANCGPTATGLRKLDVWLGEGKWDFIHFNFGIHDRNTAIKDYTERLDELVTSMKGTGAKVLWSNTTPLPDVPSKKYTAVSILDRNAAAAKVMKAHDVPINDLFSAITPHLSEWQRPDNCHYQEPGNVYLGKQVAAFIGRQLKEKH